MKKVFLSVGFKDRDEKEIRRRFGKLMRMWTMAFPDDEFEFVENYSEPGPEDAGRLWYLGRAIQKLGDCDAVVFDNDYDNFTGCLTEEYVSEMYGIEKYTGNRLKRVYLDMCEAKFKEGTP